MKENMYIFPENQLPLPYAYFFIQPCFLADIMKAQIFIKAVT